MSLPPRHWRVLVREHDGSESESTYEQPGGDHHRSRRSSSSSVGTEAVGSSSTTSRPLTRHPGGSVSFARAPSPARPRIRRDAS